MAKSLEELANGMTSTEFIEMMADKDKELIVWMQSGEKHRQAAIAIKQNQIEVYKYLLKKEGKI